LKAFRIAAETPDHKAVDISGRGAAEYGGRWNAKGAFMVYCAESVALAYLETLTSLTGGPPPRNRYLIEIDIPVEVWKRRHDADADGTLPPGWNAHPLGGASIEYGTAWLTSRTSAVLVVPSVVVPQERNILINPRHPSASRITAVNRGLALYDYRLFPSSERRLPTPL
jgi:RES domain-containing protein